MSDQAGLTPEQMAREIVNHGVSVDTANVMACASDDGEVFFLVGADVVSAVAALATTATARLAEVERERDELHGVLSGLSMYVSAGMGDDATTPGQWNERIRWGIDFLVDATVKRAEQAEATLTAMTQERDKKRADWREMVGVATKLDADLTAARARIEAVVEVLREARRELDCPHGEGSTPGFNYGHRCINCDENVDRNMDLRKRIDAALATPPTAECKVSPVSSRVCERGTKGCTVKHDPPATGHDAGGEVGRS